MTPTCIIIGSRGFVGSAVLRQAKRRGYDCLAIDVENYSDHIGAKADLLINANGNSKKFLATKDPQKEFDMSVRSVMGSLHDFTADKYIHLSTMDIYSDKENPAHNTEETEIDLNRVSPYGLHKRLAETLVQYYASRWIIFRMSGFVGSGLRKNSIYDMLTNTPLRVGIESKYQYIRTDDLARIILDIASRAIESEVFNIGGKGLIRLQEVAEMIPGYNLSYYDNGNPPSEHCEVNIDKISRLVDLPETKATVQTFVEEVVSGKVQLA